jgi:23S rRNA pseudouridine1911/1915/1917 synthase
VGMPPVAVAALHWQWQHGGLSMRYGLLVQGTLIEDAGIIDAPIGRDRIHRQRMAVRADGRAAKTDFRVLERFARYTYVDAGLPSGRTHQLRVHFGYIDHPVVADSTYGRGRAPAGLGRQFVHSHELTLTSPATQKEQTFVADLPPDLEATLDHLRALGASPISPLPSERAS